MTNLATGKYRRSTLYKISLPTIPTLQVQPRRVEIHQKPYNHDVMIIEFTQTSPLWFDTVKTGVPIKFEWDQNSVKNVWFGYVSFVLKNTAPQLEQVMEVHCVGTTFPLKQRATRSFTNSTVTAAVKTIVTEFGFNFIGEDDGRKFDQLTMAGHSYWEWIQEQAKRIGYGVLVDGMDFCFRPLDMLINQGVTNVPVLSMSGTQMKMNDQLLDRTLDSFRAINGEYIEDGSALRTNKQVAGVDPITGVVYSSQASPATVGANLRSVVNDVLFDEYRTEQVVHDLTSANSAASGAANLGRFNMPAKVKCQGDPRIRPFYPVLVQNTGVTTDGYWIAKEVKHMFARVGDYQIEMTIAVDGTGINSTTVARPGTNTTVGMVNLTEAIANGKNINFSDKSSVTLKSLSANLSMTNQGFLRTPTFWSYR